MVKNTANFVAVKELFDVNILVTPESLRNFRKKKNFLKFLEKEELSEISGKRSTFERKSNIAVN